MTSALDSGGFSTSHPVRLYDRKETDPLYRRLGGPHGLSR